MDPDALRAEFPILERLAYLNAGTDGPLAARAADAARAALDHQLGEGRFLAHFEARAAGLQQLRAAYAGMLGCAPHDVALTTSTSEGLGKVLTGLGLGPGDEILTSDQEHPGLIGPLLAAARRGVRIRTGPLATLAEHLTPATTAVACSHVGWLSGELADPGLADAGVPVVLDGAQGAGAVPVRLEYLNCAAYAAAGQKWLCGADGTGLLYVAPKWQARIAPSAPGYGGFADASQGLAGELHADARAHDTPALPREGVALSVAAARLLAEAGWDDVYARATDQARVLAERLAGAGRVVAPRAATTLVSWEDADPPAASARLAAAGVVVRHLPHTPYVRASVGAWTSDADLDRLLEAL